MPRTDDPLKVIFSDLLLNPHISQKLPPSAVMFAALHNHMVSSDVVIVDKEQRVLFIKDSSLQPGMLSYAINKFFSKKKKMILQSQFLQKSFENS